jgi:hypothetical protein
MKLLQTTALATTMLATTVSMGFCGGFKNGSELLYQCSDQDGSINGAICLGYVTAMADASSCGQVVNGFSWKAPEDVSAGQLQKVVTKWLNEHPDSLHFVASGLVANALRDAFPCK